MRSKTNNGSNFEQRVSNEIGKIRKTIKKDPHVPLFKNAHDLTRLCVTTLLKIEVISNTGSRRKPTWEWNNNIVANEKLTNKTAAIIRETRRKKYGASKTAKLSIDTVEEVTKKTTKKASTATDVNAVNKEFYSDKTEAPVFTEPTLSNFSSQELWDELKNRGWQISDGHLCKTEITVLV